MNPRRSTMPGLGLLILAAAAAPCARADVRLVPPHGNAGPDVAIRAGAGGIWSPIGPETSLRLNAEGDRR